MSEQQLVKQTDEQTDSGVAECVEDGIAIYPVYEHYSDEDYPLDDYDIDMCLLL